MFKEGHVAHKVGKAHARRSSVTIRSAQGRQTLESSRMSGAKRQQVRVSFKKASSAR